MTEIVVAAAAALVAALAATWLWEAREARRRHHVRSFLAFRDAVPARPFWRGVATRSAIESFATPVEIRLAMAESINGWVRYGEVDDLDARVFPGVELMVQEERLPRPIPQRIAARVAFRP